MARRRGLEDKSGFNVENWHDESLNEISNKKLSDVIVRVEVESVTAKIGSHEQTAGVRGRECKGPQVARPGTGIVAKQKSPWKPEVGSHKWRRGWDPRIGPATDCRSERTRVQRAASSAPWNRNRGQAEESLETRSRFPQMATRMGSSHWSRNRAEKQDSFSIRWSDLTDEDVTKNVTSSADKKPCTGGKKWRHRFCCGGGSMSLELGIGLRARVGATSSGLGFEPGNELRARDWATSPGLSFELGIGLRARD
ncbi:hypothetical protein CpipJ_CPIJ012014 [Culex quinquefasciatus]|uniref:Uncharacterized protein n=1 Tax=Culex quinquefasciatus TaxID=7176 RepID=B0WX64_CULQU|nr:hypothetical protein CpipJ_CPIJ012014 [Culex quinquefasciatus]|eukprot:XP_001861986.1 hypothetical protein CpipJ_CPIJ012014 [Culex quinquefasciatus]